MADGPWTYTIVWGDGSAHTTGSLASLTSAVTARHRYASVGTWPAMMTVRDKDGAIGRSGVLPVVASP